MAGSAQWSVWSVEYLYASTFVVAIDPRSFTNFISVGLLRCARNVIRAFHAALARAGLPRQRFHDLRHCCATIGLSAGEELVVVSRSLGHATLSTTAEIYGHMTPARGRAGSSPDGQHPRRRLTHQVDPREGHTAGVRTDAIDVLYDQKEGSRRRQG